MNETNVSERKVWFGLNDDPCDGGFFYLAHESELDELLVKHYERCPQLVLFPAATAEEEGE